MSVDMNFIKNEFAECKIAVKENEIMSSHTSFKIGGCADIYAIPDSVEKFCTSIKIAYKNNVPVFVLGKGSNILVRDSGVRGIVVSTEKLDKITVSGNKMECQCGASFTYSAIVARDNGLSGLSFAYGIPGSIGGAVYMNAGAYGGQISDVVVRTTYYDAENDEIRGCVDHKFGYRESVFKENRSWYIISSEFELIPGDMAAIKAEMDDYMERRRSKQPLEFPSAGSTFKRYPGHFTGQLIEESGLKGTRIGGAEVSEKHAGFVINRDNATAEDVLNLIDHIKSVIKANYGFELECEVIIVG